MENFKKLGYRFAKYMKDNDLGVNEMAKKLEFSGSQISNIRNGKVFGSDKMFKILNIYEDIDANWLFRGKGYEQIENDNYTIEIQRKLIEKLELENAGLKEQLSKEDIKKQTG